MCRASPCDERLGDLVRRDDRRRRPRPSALRSARRTRSRRGSRAGRHRSWRWPSAAARGRSRRRRFRWLGARHAGSVRARLRHVVRMPRATSRPPRERAPTDHVTVRECSTLDAPSDGAIATRGYSAAGASAAGQRASRGSGSQRRRRDVEPVAAEVRDQRVHVDAGARRDQPQHAVVGHDQRRRPACASTSRARRRSGEHRRRRPRRPAAPCSSPRRHAVAHPGPALVDLGAGVTLPIAAVALAEARRRRSPATPSVRGDDLGGPRAAAEVGGSARPRARSPSWASARGPGRGLGLARAR